MTHRSEFPNAEAPARTPDFTRLDNEAAVRRIRQLLATGLAERTIADITEWDVIDIRRAASTSPSRDAGS